MKKYCIVLLAIGILVASIGYAQTGRVKKNPEWELSFFAGVSMLGEAEANTPIEGTADFLSSSIEPDDGLLLGARITQNLGDYFAAEADYTFSDHGGEFKYPTPSTPALDLDQTTHSFFYSLLFYTRDPYKNLRPFITGGIGATLYALDGSIDSTSEQLGFSMNDNWKFGFRVGGGVKYRLNDKIGVRFDLADQISDTPAYGMPSVVPVEDSIPGAGYAPSGNLHNLQMSVGLIYYPENH